MGWLADSSLADARAFITRVVRLDSGAVIRLRPAGDTAGDVAEGTVGDTAGALWSRLPWGVLVSRGVRGAFAGDRTVLGRELLAALDGRLPASRDGDWHWSIPSNVGRVVERIPGADVLSIGAAAERTLRTAAAEGVGGRAVGSRVLRDALLDHVPITITTDDGVIVPVSQRLVQAVVRMGFVSGADGDFVDVRISGSWTALACTYGSAWYRGGGSLLIG